MSDTVLGGVITFFQNIGIYDIVLPFLLTFAIVFAILEKTKVLGTEKIKDDKGTEHEYSRKTLNSLVAFVLGFLAVASAQIVEAITTISSQIIILILLIIFFLTAVGIFYGKSEDVSLEKKSGFRTFFMVLTFIAILAIFLNAMKTTIDGQKVSWLEIFIGVLAEFTTNTFVAAIVLLIGIVLFMWFVVKEPKQKTKTEGE
jgi:hypothetical protein